MQVAILDYASIICAGKTFVLHLQAIIEEVTLKALICLVDKKTGEKSKTRPRFIKQDQIAIVRFQSDDVICMETFKDHPQLGRFTLRDEGRQKKSAILSSLRVTVKHSATQTGTKSWLYYVFASNVVGHPLFSLGIWRLYQGVQHV